MKIIINPTYKLLFIIQNSQCLSLSEGDSGLGSTEGESHKKIPSCKEPDDTGKCWYNLDVDDSTSMQLQGFFYS
jgi:hypothetical protein